jgi:hypothetical protein
MLGGRAPALCGIASCIHDSGIASRSKCAVISIGQISGSSAGPRGLSAEMLVSPATGDPVALVNRLSAATIVSSHGLGACPDIEPAFRPTAATSISLFSDRMGSGTHARHMMLQTLPQLKCVYS